MLTVSSLRSQFMTAALIKSMVGDFFREDEVLTAKSAIIDAVSKIGGLSIQAHIKTASVLTKLGHQWMIS